jgi:hypothetical protein
LTVTVLPATEMVPVRAAPPFPATRYVTLPFPEPDDTPVMAIQGTWDTAFQAQFALDALTLNPPLPPWYVNCWGVSCTAYTQDGDGLGCGGSGDGLGCGGRGGAAGAPSWVIVTD